MAKQIGISSIAQIIFLLFKHFWIPFDLTHNLENATDPSFSSLINTGSLRSHFNQREYFGQIAITGEVTSAGLLISIT